MRGVCYSACSLCYKTISADHQKCLLMRDYLLFKRLLLPESTVCTYVGIETFTLKTTHVSRIARLRTTNDYHQ
mgnify:CR=1 FL=1